MGSLKAQLGLSVILKLEFCIYLAKQICSKCLLKSDQFIASAISYIPFRSSQRIAMCSFRIFLY